MITKCAVPAEDAGFERFGAIYDLNCDAKNPDKNVIFSKGSDYKDGYTAAPVVNRPASIGMTVSSPMPFIALEMERHLHTWQTLMCISEPVVFLAAPETDGSLSDNDRPNAEDTVAVILKPGQVAVLNRGVWHSPAHGLKKESAYYWMAEAYDDEPTVWREILHGPVQVVMEEK